jgi:hypothetical protein
VVRSLSVAAMSLLFAGLLVPPPARAAMVVKGDPQAWSEVRTAMLRLVNAKTYRTKMTGTDGTTMVIETVLPDRFHTKGTFGGQAAEMISVGTTSRMREASGTWLCPPGAPGPPIPKVDPDTMADEITVQRGPASVIDGVPTMSYAYTTKSRDLTMHTRLYIATGTGLPKRIELLNDSGTVTSTFDYYDVGAPITIELPNCGSALPRSPTARMAGGLRLSWLLVPLVPLVPQSG